MDIPARTHLDIMRRRQRTANKAQPTPKTYATIENAEEKHRFKHWPIMRRRVMGHSMVPVLPPKTKVYAWRWFRRLKPGDIIIFEREGRETIKRVERYERNRLFVLGDHVDTSTDSRHFGAIPQEIVEAKVVWPRAKKQAI